MINWIVTSSILILIVIVLRFLLRGKISLRLQYALWLIVLIRLLVPFEFGAAEFSLLNQVEQIPIVREFESVQRMEEIEQIDEKHVQIIYERTPEDVNRPVKIYEMTEEEFTRERTVFQTNEILSLLWKAGAAVMLAVFLISNVRFGLKLTQTRKMLQAGECGKTLPVYVSCAVETPCLFGLFRPVIYVTPEAAVRETVLRHTIEHETTHYLHKDHIWSFLRCIALAMHWYNPLVWFAVKLSKADGELACDEATIKRIGESERAAYGRTLIEMTRPGRDILLGMATTMTGSKSSLKERIELIAKKPKMAAYTLVTVLLIAAVAAVCTFSGPVENPYHAWLQLLTLLLLFH